MRIWIRSVVTINVYLPNSQTTLVTHSGTCMISTNKVLENVLFVPEFKHNLLSVS